MGQYTAELITALQGLLIVHASRLLCNVCGVLLRQKSLLRPALHVAHRKGYQVEFLLADITDGLVSHDLDVARHADLQAVLYACNRDRRSCSPEDVHYNCSITIFNSEGGCAGARRVVCVELSRVVAFLISAIPTVSISSLPLPIGTRTVFWPFCAIANTSARSRREAHCFGLAFACGRRVCTLHPRVDAISVPSKRVGPSQPADLGVVIRQAMCGQAQVGWQS